MSLENKVGIVMPARNEWHLAEGGGLLERVLKEVPGDLRPTIFVCANNSDPAFVEKLRDVETQDDRIKIIDLGTTKPLGWAYAYLYGLSVAKEDVDTIIEMDANGSHDPIYIKEFIDVLKRGNGAALSTRFSNGGSVDKYPLQRQLISRMGTIAANLTLGLGQPVSDMTSGYEAFSKDVLGDVFSRHQIKEWISVTRGPGHFYQTEMRAKVIWGGHRFAMIPMVWGTDRMVEPETLPIRTVLDALKSLMVLRKMKNQFT